jgi:hypothetical protein
VLASPALICSNSNQTGITETMNVEGKQIVKRQRGFRWLYIMKNGALRGFDR